MTTAADNRWDLAALEAAFETIYAAYDASLRYVTRGWHDPAIRPVTATAFANVTARYAADLAQLEADAMAAAEEMWRQAQVESGVAE